MLVRVDASVPSATAYSPTSIPNLISPLILHVTDAVQQLNPPALNRSPKHHPRLATVPWPKAPRHHQMVQTVFTAVNWPHPKAHKKRVIRLLICSLINQIFKTSHNLNDSLQEEYFQGVSSSTPL